MFVLIDIFWKMGKVIVLLVSVSRSMMAREFNLILMAEMRW